MTTEETEKALVEAAEALLKVLDRALVADGYGHYASVLGGGPVGRAADRLEQALHEHDRAKVFEDAMKSGAVL